MRDKCGTFCGTFAMQKTPHYRGNMVAVGLWDILRTYTHHLNIGMYISSFMEALLAYGKKYKSVPQSHKTLETAEHSRYLRGTQVPHCPARPTVQNTK